MARSSSVPEAAAFYLLGVASGFVLGVVGAVLVLGSPGDGGMRDALKGRTKLQRMRDAGIGVVKKG